MPIAAVAAAGVAWFMPLILHAESAGFGMKDLPWYQYFFTQWRALFVYIGMFLLPINLNADWDFPFSRTVMDHGAIIGLLGLAVLTGAAWHFRRRFPLACFGFFVFLVLMAPTSSILPIRDPIAERRLYFSMLGLILIVVDLLDRTKLERRQLTAITAVVALAAAVATHARAEVWSDGVLLWEDTVRKSPGKIGPTCSSPRLTSNSGGSTSPRPSTNGRPDWNRPSHDLLANWGLCLLQHEPPAGGAGQTAGGRGQGADGLHLFADRDGPCQPVAMAGGSCGPRPSRKARP